MLNKIWSVQADPNSLVIDNSRALRICLHASILDTRTVGINIHTV